MKEPIAVVGIGLRFPGNLDSADALSAFLADRRSAICDIPADRWDKDAFFHADFRRAGRISVTRGGFIDRIAEFDAAFFGISPHEARRMDPQQRLVLETCFEAIEDAGMPLERLRGRFVPVTIGAGLRDYDAVLGAASERVNIGATTNTGSALSIIANRVSYLFDLRGPSFAVDTACSSSLTALHYACRSLWDDGAYAALCGGVNLLIKPELTMGFSKGGFLSPDAACKAFSADANGYVRSEGAAAVLLRPLSQALADGDRIYALIRGTALNQDGRTPGMTVPSGEAQRELLLTAFRDAGVDPKRASYVEAHGTGTPTGDPIEATAIGEVVGAGREDHCYIGSVKTNLGHMECAAGMAGLIKLALTLCRRRTFPNLHFSAPNPKIPFDRLHLRVSTDEIALPVDRPIFGGVNSFGFGGANGHAVLESPPPSRVPAIVEPEGPAVMFFSARSPSALRTLGGRIGERAADERASIGALAAGLSRRRSRFELRAAVVGGSRTEIVDTLAAYAKDGGPRPGLFEGRAAEGTTPRVGFVFTGQGAQWWAMGRTLVERDPVVRETVHAVDAELKKLGWTGASLVEELTRDEKTSRMGETTIAQPAIFALQVGLTRWLERRGVRASAVTGHSIGELAAFVAAGALTLEEGARIVYWRSRCQAQAEGKGKMIAIGLAEAEVRTRLAAYAGQLELAAVNGPALCTVAGTHEAAARLLTELERAEVFCRALDVSVPFHCFLMDPIEGEFVRRLGEVTRRDADTAIFSTVTGARVAGATLDAGYFYRNIREPVRYLHAVRAMIDDGVRCFVEIGPHPALSRGTLETLRAAGVNAAIIPTLRRDGDDLRQLHATLAQLFVAGAPGEATDHVLVPHAPLPRQPMERQTFWLETAEGREARLRPRCADHPHVRTIRASAHANEVLSCEVDIDARTQPYVGEHKVQGTIVFPAAGQLELVSSVARLAGAGADIVLEDVEFKRPIMAVSGEDDDTRFRLDFYSDDGSFVIASRNGPADAPWVEHTRGRATRIDQPMAPLDRDTVARLRARRDAGELEDVPPAEVYRSCSAIGLELGPSFRGIVRYARSPATGEALTEIEAPRDLDGGFFIHPAVLDTIFQTMVSSAQTEGDVHRLFLPHRVGRLKLHRTPGPGRITAYARVTHRDSEERRFDVWAVDEAGEPIASVSDFVVRHVHGSGEQTGPAFHAFAWREMPLPEGEPLRRLTGHWLMLDDGDALGRRLSETLREAGASVTRVATGRAFSCDDGIYTVRPGEDMAQLAEAVSARGPVAGIVHAWRARSAESPLATVRDDASLGMVPLGALMTALGERGAWADTRELWILTSGAQTLDGDTTAQAGGGALWGFSRTLASELPSLQITIADVGCGQARATELAALVAELRHGPSAHELALRDDRRCVHELVARPEARPTPQPIDIGPTQVRAVARTPGILDSVTLETTALPEPGPDEVELAVHAVGLIFRDVVVGMAMLQRDAWEHGLAGAELGSDVAGVITRVGSNVRELAVGDAVMGLAPRALATRAIAHRSVLRKIRPGLSFAEAAALPTCWLTAAVALKRLAHLERGETVLIHAAAGGVGLMAVQLAQSMGAQVIATTSSEQKREVLRSLGVEHIFQSRDARFRAAVMEATGGRGVDVVLNSLSGQSFTESLLCLRPFGRFIDIGKTDVYRNRQIGLKVFGENRAYFCLDINRWHTERAEVLMSTLDEGMRERLDGCLKLMPLTRFPLSQSSAALRHFAAGKHVGRIVIDVPQDGTIEAELSPKLALSASDVFLVTGGTSGFGLKLAQRLVERGARKLVLASRGGPKTGADEEAIDALKTRAQVEVVRCDVAAPGMARRLVDQARGLGRLAGVFHLAMVLDDAPIATQDATRYARVLGPKAEGAIHLHEATKDQPLDHFVLFSSVASVVGTPGQANYAAANAVLDQLARARRSAGLAATSISWGIIADVGVVARATPEQRRKIEGQGVRGVGSQRALDLLERALVSGLDHALCASIDWRRLARVGASAKRPGRFASLQEGGAATGGQPLRELLDGLPEADRPRALAVKLGEFVAQLAGLAQGGVDVDTSLSRYGLDSLMVVQLQNFLEEQTRVPVAMVRLMKGPSLVELAGEILVRMNDAGAGGAGDEGWLRPVSGGPGARFRLFCFPYFGGDADAFAVFTGALPEDVEVLAVDLPSFGGTREALLTGPPQDFRRALSEAIGDKVDLPFAFYGHSLGAILALEITRNLASSGRGRPAFVALGAVPTDDALTSFTPGALADASDITDDMVRDAMRRLGIANLSLDDDTTRRVVERVRRDLWLVHHRDAERDSERWLTVDGVPHYLFGGQRDAVPTLDKGGSPLAVDSTTLVPGGHLFLGEREARDELVRHLRTHVERALAP